MNIINKETWNTAIDNLRKRVNIAVDHIENFTPENHPEYTDDDYFEDEKYYDRHQTIDLLVQELEKLTNIKSLTYAGGNVDSGPSGFQYVYNIIYAYIDENNNPQIYTSKDIEFATWDSWEDVFESMKIEEDDDF